MQVVKVLSVNQEVQHVVSLTANLQASFHPIQGGGLKEFCSLERTEEVAAMMK